MERRLCDGKSSLYEPHTGLCIELSLSRAGLRFFLGLTSCLSMVSGLPAIVGFFHTALFQMPGRLARRSVTTIKSRAMFDRHRVPTSWLCQLVTYSGSSKFHSEIAVVVHNDFFLGGSCEDIERTWLILLSLFFFGNKHPISKTPVICYIALLHAAFNR